MKKLCGQIALLLGIVVAFATFNLAIYNTFTYRCIHRYGEQMQAKSIELDAYLPFVEDTQIVKVDSSLTLSGDLPVIDGAAALYPIFSATVHAIYPEGCVHFDGENFSDDSALQYRNTRGAYRAIVDGEVDIAICVAPSEEQLAYAEECGVELVFTPIGQEAFVFLVNQNNPVDDLGVDEVRGIYTGEFRSWAQLGGEDKPIAVLTRNEGSGSQSALLNFMEGRPVKKDYDAFLGSAIGFSFRFYVEGIVEDGKVKLLSLDGVYPSVENIRNGSYPVINELYAVYRADNDNPNVKTVVDWLLSDEGQDMIERTGYVGLANNFQ